MFRTHWFHSVAAHFLEIGHCHFANRPLPFCKFYIFRFYFLASIAVLQIYMFFGFTFCESATAVLQIYNFSVETVVLFANRPLPFCKFAFFGFTLCKSPTAVLQIGHFFGFTFANRPLPFSVTAVLHVAVHQRTGDIMRKPHSQAV